ncbi:protein KAKU4 isoform X1 [Cajanus cajan]|uniref:protein KAKU4 isoform X1 n=1 Tax=Cajanus cajan TaxID=3821 RepID=UPI00098DCFFD|nr:protein KAKU4 isoform X1 [Cajanus cajan]
MASRSGGKIIRTRRTAAARSRTPYDRPPPPPEPPSPNWLSRFVVSPTRFIASGAGKLLYSVLDLDSSPTSSSSVTSSPSSSANGSDAEEGGTFDMDNDNPLEGDVALSKGLPPSDGNNKNKHIIEQLLRKESFSREECDRLINIIRSRVVDPSNDDDDGDKRPMYMLNRTLGSDTDSPDLHSTAIMEAKKWLQEKKSELDTNSDIGYGSPSLNLVALPQAPKDEGSPVDVAKSYMRSRPPWASPSIDHTRPRTPSGIQLFKEETPYLFGNNSTSSSKLKRDSSATGSWSIQDEIRRVRSRATEDLLRTLPSSKIDWSAFAVENKNNVNSSAIETIGERVHNSTNLVDASANLAGGLGSQVSPDLESKLDGFQPESVLSDPVNINFEQNQGSDVQQTKGTQDDDNRERTTSGLRDGSLNDIHRDGSLVRVNGTNDRNGSGHQPDSVEETREAINSRLQDSNHLVIKEKTGAEDALANGFPASGPSIYAGQVIEENTKTLTNTNDSSQERTGEGVVEHEASKTLRESTEVPDVVADDSVGLKQDDGVPSGSQNSSSVYEVQPDSSQAGAESGLPATPTSIAKQKGKRITTRYNRRGRNKGGVK